jgi:hypothetical protein
MFCNIHDNVMDKALLPYTTTIIDASTAVELGFSGPSYNLPKPLPGVH